MADVTDIASDSEQLAKDIKLAAIRKMAEFKPPRRKTCMNCGEKTKKGARFCDIHCQQDHEKRKAAEVYKVY